MCTATVITCDDGSTRLMFNRDEQRTRRRAEAPRVHQVHGTMALFPIDAQAGGTWIAVNQAGLGLALLNVSDDCRPQLATRRFRSRGKIIEGLIGSASRAIALDRFAALDPSEFRAFRLLLIERGSVVTLRFDGQRVSRERHDSSRFPLLFASSGLGDSVVDGPRRALFDEILGAARSDSVEAAQMAFHGHCWPNARHVSVLMERVDARTVSTTTVTLGEACASMRYTEPAAAQMTEGHELSIDLIGASRS